MSDTNDESFRARLDVEGPAAPPRANGELVFDAPWQSRVFGMTMTLCDQGRIDWDAFRDELIVEIGRWDAAHGVPTDACTKKHEERADYRYWEHWLAALTRLLGERELLTTSDLEARQRELAARPAGHDHAH